jgi:hypothetical protein
MALRRINGKFPILLFQLDQALHEADGILEVDVHINNSVTDQQGALASSVTGSTAHSTSSGTNTNSNLPGSLLNLDHQDLLLDLRLPLILGSPKSSAVTALNVVEPKLLT